jgi:hypothetical protein
MPHDLLDNQQQDDEIHESEIENEVGHEENQNQGSRPDVVEQSKLCRDRLIKTIQLALDLIESTNIDESIHFPMVSEPFIYCPSMIPSTAFRNGGNHLAFPTPYPEK